MVHIQALERRHQMSALRKRQGQRAEEPQSDALQMPFMPQALLG